MSYRRYEATNFNNLDVEQLQEALESEWTIVAVDAAKHWQYAAVFRVDLEARSPDEMLCRVELFRWTHPFGTREVLKMLKATETETLSVVLEPSGSYPNGMVEWLQQADAIDVHQMRPKKTHDNKESFDNVPSSHDAKAADVIARLHWAGASRPWRERAQQQRRLRAAVQRVDRYDRQQGADRNRLEAKLGEYWPELERQLGLDSTTLLTLVAKYGCPDNAARHPEEAKETIRRASRGQIGPRKTRDILQAAQESIGRTPVDEMVKFIKEIAERQLELKRKIREAKQRVSDLEDGCAPAENIRAFAGKMVAGGLLGEVGDPNDFKAAAAYEKAAGLNLVEDTSGNEGQHTNNDDAPPMRISKRGSSRARKYLYMATQRWIQDCPVARAWYKHKCDQYGGADSTETVALVALMRKLIKLLYHIGRGSEYDPTELFDVEMLEPRLSTQTIKEVRE